MVGNPISSAHTATRRVQPIYIQPVKYGASSDAAQNEKRREPETERRTTEQKKERRSCTGSVRRLGSSARRVHTYERRTTFCRSSRFSSAYVLAARAILLLPLGPLGPLALLTLPATPLLLPRVVALLSGQRGGASEHPILPAAPRGFGRHSSISLDFKALKQVSKSRPRKNLAPPCPCASLRPPHPSSLVILLVRSPRCIRATSLEAVNRRFAAWHRSTFGR